MYFSLLKLADWDMDKYQLVLQISSIVAIIIILVYVVLSSKNSE